MAGRALLSLSCIYSPQDIHSIGARNVASGCNYCLLTIKECNCYGTFHTSMGEKLLILSELMIMDDGWRGSRKDAAGQFVVTAHSSLNDQPKKSITKTVALLHLHLPLYVLSASLYYVVFLIEVGKPSKYHRDDDHCLDSAGRSIFNFSSSTHKCV